MIASLFADGPFKGDISPVLGVRLTPAGWQARVEIRGAVGGLLTRRFFLEGLRGYLDEISDRDLSRISYSIETLCTDRVQRSRREILLWDLFQRVCARDL